MEGVVLRYSKHLSSMKMRHMLTVILLNSSLFLKVKQTQSFQKYFGDKNIYFFIVPKKIDKGEGAEVV